MIKEKPLSLKLKDNLAFVSRLRSDTGTEFKNHVLDEFCISKGILRQYSVPITPAQNGVVERKNRTLIEAARTMIADSGLPLSL